MLAERSRSEAAPKSASVLLWLNRAIWTLLVGAVILLGSIVSLGRYFLPSIESHQQQVVAEINRRTGLQFSIGHISGRWQRLSPHFVIDDLRLSDPSDPQRIVLQIPHAELQLGLFRSVDARTLAISRLQISGAHLQLEEVAPGQWNLPGFTGPSTLPFQRVVDFLVAIYRATLTDSMVDLHYFEGGEAHVAAKTLQLQRAGDFRRLNLELRVSNDLNENKKEAPLRVVIEANGDPRVSNHFAGRSYAEFREVDLTPVLRVAKAFGIDMEHGRVDGAAWFNWNANGDFDGSGRIEIPQLDLAGISKFALAPMKNIKTEFLVRQRDGKRQVWLPELTGTWHNIALKFPHISTSIDDAQPQRLRLSLQELHVAPVVDAMVADTNLPEHLRNIFSTLSPQGVLSNLQIDLPLSGDEHFETLRLRAQLQTLSVQPCDGAPGVTNASGYIDSGLRAGLLDLASENFSLIFPHVYREPVHFDSVRGQVSWRADSEQVIVDSGPIDARSEAGVATTQFSLDLPHAHEARSLMTLQVGLRNSATQFRDRFIPYTLEPSLLQWLQRAIGKGDLPIGGFIYRGSLRDGDHLNRSVQLFLQAHDADLAYQPDWPPLRDTRAGVWIDDADVRVQVARARLYDRVALHDGEVNLNHQGDVGWLTVDAMADADNDDVLRLLRETPLRKRVGSTLDRWHWNGATQSKVQLGIAISGSRPQEINVDSHFNGGKLNLADQNIVLDDVRGDLTYRDATGLSSDNLKVKWFDKPAAIKIATARDNTIAIDAQGRIAMADMQQWLRQPLFGYAAGETPFTATLQIANNGTAFRVDTDLRGVAIELPPPYRKLSEQSLPLNVTMTMNSDSALTATLSDWVDLNLRWKKTETNPMQLNAGVVRLGQKGKVVLNDGQLVVTGAVAAANLSEWHTAISARSSTTPNNNDSDSSDPLAVQIREVHFDNARIAGQTLRDLIVSGRRDNAAWTVQMRAEQIAGTLTIPDVAKSPWRAHLNYVRLPAPLPNPPDKNAEEHDQVIENIDPRDAPSIDLRIDRIWRGEEEFGWLETQLRPIDNGLQFGNLKGELRAVKISARDEQPASLIWTREGANDRSEFFGRLSVDDINPALQRWRYEPVLTSKRGRADIALKWPGRPDQFKFIQADGNAALNFEDGRFLRASGSTTGALKVVGIFNFANFLRRLQLDFSDIYKNGVSFDEMKGSFSMREGVLNTEDPVEIKSPSSRFRLAGKIDFNNDQTDMELVATLPVASNLPWVAALTGALPAAAGLYVASKVFENQFDKFSSAAYAVSGPWTDPQVKFRRVFDDQLPKKEALPQNFDSTTKPSDATALTPEKTP